MATDDSNRPRFGAGLSGARAGDGGSFTPDDDPEPADDPTDDSGGDDGGGSSSRDRSDDDDGGGGRRRVGEGLAGARPDEPGAFTPDPDPEPAPTQSPKPDRPQSGEGLSGQTPDEMGSLTPDQGTDDTIADRIQEQTDEIIREFFDEQQARTGSAETVARQAEFLNQQSQQANRQTNRQAAIEDARQQAEATLEAQTGVALGSGDIAFDVVGDNLTASLTAQGRERVAVADDTEIERQLLEDLDEQTNADLDAGDVDISAGDEGFTAELTQSGRRKIDIESDPIVGLAEGTPLEGLARTGAGIGFDIEEGARQRREQFLLDDEFQDLIDEADEEVSQVLGPAPDLPNIPGEELQAIAEPPIRDFFETGQANLDQIATGGLTQRPAEAAEELLETDPEQLGQAAVTAGAVGVVAPEPATSVGGAGAVLAGGAILGGAAVASELSRRDLDFNPPEIEVPEGREPVMGSELEAPTSRQPVAPSELAEPQGREPVAPAEQEVPEEGAEIGGSELEIPEDTVDTFPTISTQETVTRQRQRRQFEDPELGFPEEETFVILEDEVRRLLREDLEQRQQQAREGFEFDESADFGFRERMTPAETAAQDVAQRQQVAEQARDLANEAAGESALQDPATAVDPREDLGMQSPTDFVGPAEAQEPVETPGLRFDVPQENVPRLENPAIQDFPFPPETTPTVQSPAVEQFALPNPTVPDTALRAPGRPDFPLLDLPSADADPDRRRRGIFEREFSEPIISPSEALSTEEPPMLDIDDDRT